MKNFVSVIVPVYREASVVLACLDRLFSQAGDFEVIVVDGEVEASTLAVIEDERVVCLRSDAGRAVQMNAGARVAKGDVLLFLHVDTFLPEGAFLLMDQFLESDKDVVGGAFDFSFDGSTLWHRVFSVLTTVRSRWSRVPYGDQGQFFRRSVFDALGGYPEQPFLEDVAMMCLIKRRGMKIGFIVSAISTSDRRYRDEGWLRRVFRNRWIMLQYTLGVSLERLKY